MSISSTSMSLIDLQKNEQTTTMVSEKKVNYLGPIELVEGHNVTFGLELLAEPASDVIVSVVFNTLASGQTGTLKPVVLFPLAGVASKISDGKNQLTLGKNDWKSSTIYMISVGIVDDDKVNPRRREEIDVTLSSPSFAPSNDLVVALHVTENDQLECLPGFHHRINEHGKKTENIDEKGQKSADCRACSTGKYSDQPGLATCTTCPADTFSSLVASSTSTNCEKCKRKTTTYFQQGNIHQRRYFFPPTFLSP
jgi:hypothetical protein